MVQHKNNSIKNKLINMGANRKETVVIIYCYFVNKTDQFLRLSQISLSVS